jgi:hypothetical protein
MSLTYDNNKVILHVRYKILNFIFRLLNLAALRKLTLVSWCTWSNDTGHRMCCNIHTQFRHQNKNLYSLRIFFFTNIRPAFP